MKLDSTTESAMPIAHRERVLNGGEVLSDRWLHYMNSPVGAPERLIASDGTVAATLDWKVWGTAQELPGATASTSLRYMGQLYDEETGLSYNRFRYYSPEEGRFISADPSGLVGSMNPFACSGNPLSWVDPLGLMWNYRLRKMNADGTPGPVYYHGKAADKATPAQVMYRHKNNKGADGARLTRNDQLEVITPNLKNDSNHDDVVAGIEQMGLEEDDTKNGQRACKSEGIPKKVRGNAINKKKNADTHRAAAQAYLDGKGTTVSALPALSVHTLKD